MYYSSPYNLRRLSSYRSLCVCYVSGTNVVKKIPQIEDHLMSKTNPFFSFVFTLVPNILPLFYVPQIFNCHFSFQFSHTIPLILEHLIFARASLHENKKDAKFDGNKVARMLLEINFFWWWCHEINWHRTNSDNKGNLWNIDKHLTNVEIWTQAIFLWDFLWIFMFFFIDAYKHFDVSSDAYNYNTLISLVTSNC